MHKWFVCNKFDDAANMAADFLAGSIKKCIDENGICHVILPGGKTPIPCLKKLSEYSLSWDKVHWYVGDERCYPQGHPERNDLMLDKNFWSGISQTNIHHIAAELGAAKAAEKYREDIKSVDVFDIAFLGIGEDGHTASLFPGNKALDDKRSVVPVYNSPKPPEDRVSLSMTTLRNTRIKIVLAGGITKSSIISEIKAGKRLPINSIGDIHWYIDEAANTTE